MSNEKASDAAGWKFDNSYAQLPDSFFSFVEPTPVRDPEVVIFNENLAQSLGLDNERLKSEEGIAALSGNRIPEGARPLAQAYAGHQFGHFTMLGDGRAILLGEHIAPSGERFDIQLKGAGLTPYSRQGDGRAALGPMLREYIVSEAMHALGIPTTRGLAVVKTGETIFRETRLPGAILTRVASSHIRVGTFEFAARWGTVEQLRALADYTLRRHFPKAFDEENCYLALLGEVIEKQAELIAKWQLVGFVHGVMNTDNMAVSGETIDYGPCAFMDVYNPQTVFSSIDVHGRYSYGNQPLMAEWNLSRFAEALLPLLHSDRQKAIERAQEAIDRFADRYRFYWLSGMRAKLGLFNAEEEDESLIEEWLDIMEKRHLDFIRSFRLLSIDKEEEIGLGETPEFSKWLDRWKRRRSRQEPSEREAKRLMRDNNPAIIARNHLVEEALEAAVERNDYSVARRLLNALQNPFDDDPKYEQYMSAPRENRPYVTYCGT